MHIDEVNKRSGVSKMDQDDLEVKGILAIEIAHRFNTHQMLLDALKLAEIDIAFYCDQREKNPNEDSGLIEIRKAIEAASFVEVEE